MDDFIKSVIQSILKKWNELPSHEKDKIRPELINTFIAFLGEGKQYNKKIVGIHLT